MARWWAMHPHSNSEQRMMKTIALIACMLLARTGYAQQPAEVYEATIQQLLATIEANERTIAELRRQLAASQGEPTPAYEITMLTMQGCEPCRKAEA